MPVSSVIERQSCASHGCSRGKYVPAPLSSHTRRGLSVVLQQGLVPVHGLPHDQISIVEEDSPILLRSTFLISKIWASDGEQALQFRLCHPTSPHFVYQILFMVARTSFSVVVPKGDSEGDVAPA
jgi:hypothetical protein